jgi:hypothetical protein
MPALDADSGLLLTDRLGLTTAVLGIEGFFRTVAGVAVLMLLATFPQRVLRSARDNNKSPSHNQALLSANLVVLALSPTMCLYGVIVFWQDFHLLDDVTDLGQKVNETASSNQTVTIPFPSFMYLFTTASFGGWMFSLFATSLYLLALFLLPILWFSNLLNRHPKEEITVPPRLSDVSEVSEDGSEMHLVEEEETADATAFFTAKLKVKAVVANLSERWGRVDCSRWDLYFVCSFYLIMLLICGFGLEINVSIVPVVHAITLIRMCMLNTTDFVPFSDTYSNLEDFDFDGFTVPAGSLITLTRYSFALQADLPLCSPEQVDARLFLRVVCLATLGFIECWLVYYVFAASTRTSLFLRGQNYIVFRREVLEYQFFRNLFRLSFFFVFAIGVLATSLNPIDSYSLYNAQILLDFDDAGRLNLTVETFQDVLFQTGKRCCCVVVQRFVGSKQLLLPSEYAK